MNVWDFIHPHRVLINQALHKEADDFRAYVDEYKADYDRRVLKCKEELQQYEEKKQSELNDYIEQLKLELQGEKEILDAVAGDIVVYFDAFFRKNYIVQLIEIENREKDILFEEYLFIKKQIDLIDEEISKLKERQNVLSSYIDVSDIIQLASESGCQIDFSKNEDAASLLEKITSEIDRIETYNAEKFALIRLREIVLERSEYLSTIDYLKWAIQQKIQFSKSLSKLRSENKEKQNMVKDCIGEYKNEISKLTAIIDEKTEAIKRYWIKPIAYINADREYADQKKQEKKDKIHQKKEEIDRNYKEIEEKKERKRYLASIHSDNQFEWDDLTSSIKNLHSKNDSLRNDINSLKSDLDLLNKSTTSLSADRKKWIEKSDYINSLCKKHGIPLRKTDYLVDEKKIIEIRLAKIESIREAGLREAAEKKKQKREEIRKHYDRIIRSIDAQISELERKLEVETNNRDSLKRQAEESKEIYKKTKENDKRFFVKKLFAPTKEVAEAQRTLIEEKEDIKQSEKRIKELTGNIRELREKRADEMSKSIIAYDRCYVRVDGPSEEELLEEKKLKIRIRTIEEQLSSGTKNKRKVYANKN